MNQMGRLSADFTVTISTVMTFLGGENW